jgi:hypothetical protein
MLSGKNVMGNKKAKKWLSCLLFVGLTLTLGTVFADGTDLLAGTSADLAKTITGEGKKYLYLSELVVGAIGFIKTRNPAIFIGIIILSVGFNALLTIIGISP